MVQHKSAYTTGFYNGDISLIKPVWNNLTEAQK
nr:MAG TPA: ENDOGLUCANASE D [Bacteriophage sp.]